jgi:hypothetical protein
MYGRFVLLKYEKGFCAVTNMGYAAYAISLLSKSHALDTSRWYVS